MSKHLELRILVLVDLCKETRDREWRRYPDVSTQGSAQKEGGGGGRGSIEYGGGGWAKTPSRVEGRRQRNVAWCQERVGGKQRGKCSPLNQEPQRASRAPPREKTRRTPPYPSSRASLRFLQVAMSWVVGQCRVRGMKKAIEDDEREGVREKGELGQGSSLHLWGGLVTVLSGDHCWCRADRLGESTSCPEIHGFPVHDVPHSEEAPTCKPGTRLSCGSMNGVDQGVGGRLRTNQSSCNHECQGDD